MRVSIVKMQKQEKCCTKIDKFFEKNSETAKFASMNKKLLIFNPDNDLALAYGMEGYTAPPHAQQLRRDLQMLPVWFHDNKDCAILSQNRSEDCVWLETYASKWVEAVTDCVGISQLQNRKFECCIPWGWNLDLRQRLINSGMQESALPSRERILQMREWSHRGTTIKVFEWLKSAIDYRFPASPIEVYSVAEILEFEKKNPQCFIKAPWSSSGRGIYRVLEPESRNFTTWAQGIINRQGSIMCEQAFDKVMDFALEYVVQGGKVSFFGYSIFHNDAHNSFDVGFVAKGEKLRQMIVERLGDESLLDNVTTAIKDFIQAKIAHPDLYPDGCIGVDMMLYRDEDGRVMLNPCIEMNLRRTMGHVAVSLGDAYAADGAVGHFHVEYLKYGGVAEYINALTGSRPIVQPEDGSGFNAGVMPLVPAYPDSKYCAYIDFGEVK